MLRGLSTVQLCIALHRGHQGGHLVRAHEDCEDYVSKSISTIKRLEALPLNKVTVVINDDRQASDSISHPQWTKTEKLAFAETVRANLVADHTAEIQQRTEEVRKVRKQRLAALPSKEKRERAYVRYRKHLVNEAAKKLKAMDDARRVLVNKVEIMVGLAVELESERQRQIVEGEKYKLRNMKIEETHLWYRYRDLQKRLDEVLKDSSLAKCQPLKRRYLSEDSGSDRKDLGSDTEDSGSGGEES